jgi:hypothetical protein
MSVGRERGFGGRAILPEATEAEPEAAPAEPPRAAEPRLSDVPFPPPDLTAPLPRSAKDGDGRWLRLGQPGDRAAEGEALLFHTTLHPHPVSAFDSLTLVAIDLARAEVRFMPGSRDPGADQLDPPAGLVPEAERDALIAVFNGGWLPRHGRWGMAAADRVLLPPRQEGCTVALYRDGRVRIATWSELAGEVDAIAAYRQTPPCMVEQGKLHPLLDAGNEAPWGGHDPNRKTRRRSALGIDASGGILFYGFGVEVGPELLARGMLHGGAVAVAELDINWTGASIFEQLAFRRSCGEMLGPSSSNWRFVTVAARCSDSHRGRIFAKVVVALASALYTSATMRCPCSNTKTTSSFAPSASA